MKAGIASNIAVGAVRVPCGFWKPLIALNFWSGQLNNAQRNYPDIDRELLAVSYAVDKFRSYLEGQPIVVRTDHDPLVGSVTKKADTALPFTRSHLLNIAQFVDQLHYLKGERNGSPMHCLVCDNSATPSAYGCRSRMMSQTSLPTEGSHYAIQEDTLVDQTFIQRLKRQRRMHCEQVRASVFVPAASAFRRY